MSPTLLRRPVRPRTSGARASLRTTTGAVALGALLLTGTSALALPSSPAAASTAEGAEDVPVSGEACTDSTGITVVVDFPAADDSADGADDVGEVVVGCATDSAGGTGTEALQAAGFTDTRDAASMVCAVDSFPDPCPTEFTGDWWSYWYADLDGDAAGEWQQQQEGSDTSITQERRVEGWRYSDGSAGPRVEPAALLEALEPPDATPTEEAATEDEPTAQDGATQSPTPEQTTAADADAEASQDEGVPAWVWFAGGLVALALLVLAVNAVRRPADGPRGQD